MRQTWISRTRWRGSRMKPSAWRAIGLGSRFRAREIGQMRTARLRSICGRTSGRCARSVRTDIIGMRCHQRYGNHGEHEWRVDDPVHSSCCRRRSRLRTSGLWSRATQWTRVIYNFWATSYAEHVALLRAPFIGPKALRKTQRMSGRRPTIRPCLLGYNPVDARMVLPLPPPSRSPARIFRRLCAGMIQASDDIKTTTGQYDASLGARGNETSGRAINARQRESDTFANFHFIDNVAKGGRNYASRIMVGVLPKLYDTRRVAASRARMARGSCIHRSEQPAEAMQEDPAGNRRDQVDLQLRCWPMRRCCDQLVRATRPEAEAADMMTQIAQRTSDHYHRQATSSFATLTCRARRSCRSG